MNVHLRPRAVAILLTLLVATSACGGLDSGPTAAELRKDQTTEPDIHSVPDTGSVDLQQPDLSGPDALDLARDLASEDTQSADQSFDQSSEDASDVLIPLPELKTKSPVSSIAPDPLSGSKISGCTTFKQEHCDNGVLKTCTLYDTKKKEWVDKPDPLLNRVLLFERWYDLYFQPNGLRVERRFVGGTKPGTPEKEWSTLAHFLRYEAAGDSALHSWPAMMAKAIRYVLGGTESDYQRLERHVKQYLTLFDVTGMPGYLARVHLLHYDKTVKEGAPKSDKHVIWYTPDSLGHRDFKFDPTNIPNMPADYLNGLKDTTGKLVKGTPIWHGNPSIDSYTGATVALPFVYSLLRDETLKKKIVTNITCYLKRLRRIEVINIQSNKQVLEALTNLLAGGGYKVLIDPDDLDLTKLDKVVAYYLPSYNKASMASYDKSCPDTIAMKPIKVIDAKKANWGADLATMALDLQSASMNRKGSIDHIYIPSVRGGDAIHMIHLAVLAYHFTGNEMYRKFLFEELIGNLKADRVAALTSALLIPDHCGTYYGDHITISPLWALLTLLEDSDLKTQMQQVMESELWQKRAYNLRSLKFSLLYASETPDSIATAKKKALDQVLGDLPKLAGNSLNPKLLDDPRRNYDIPTQYVLDNLPPDNSVRCPTPEEREFCEVGVSVLGIKIPVEIISFDCTGAPGECKLADGKCSRPLSSVGLPQELRYHEASWYGSSPYEIGRVYQVQGDIQSPGLELIEPYWIARFYGFIKEGDGQVLAWKTGGTCN